MRRHFYFALIAVFLCVQAFSLLHMAEHGFAEHKHNGHVCDIYLHGEYAKYATADTPVTPAPPKYVVLHVSLPDQAVIHSETYPTASPRAPPLFS